MVDATVSLFVAANVSWMMTDKDKIRSILADIPLVEGRSVISDELCDDAISTYYQTPKEIWTKNRESNDPNATTLQLIQTFVKNCEKRSAFENTLKKQHQLSPDEPVSIPSPGVPRDFEFEKVSNFTDDEDQTGIHEVMDSTSEQSFVDTSTFEDSSVEKWESFDSYDKGAK